MIKDAARQAARAVSIKTLDKWAVYGLIWLGGVVFAYNYYHVSDMNERIERMAYREELMYISLQNMSDAYNQLSRDHAKLRYDYEREK